MTINDLKPGLKIYDVTLNDFIWYDYLCQMPVNNSLNKDKYFIFINKKFEKPIRLYKDDVERILKMGIFNLEDCLNKQIELCEEHLNYLKKRKHDRSN